MKQIMTNAEKKVYNAIWSYQKKHGYPPTIRDIMQITGHRSSSSVHSLIKNLENKGYIKRNHNSPRAIQILK